MADDLKATPRNALLGLLADALSGANDYAQRADRTMPGGRANPVLALLADNIGLPGAARTADRLSYGEPVTNIGKANVPMLPSDTADALMLGSSVAPFVSRGMLKASDAAVRAITGNPEATATGVLDYARGMNPISAAAQSQSGREQRMAEMGLERGWFRGGPSPVDGKRTGPWYTRDADEASGYAKRFGENADVREYAIPAKGYLNADNSYSSKLANDLASLIDQPYYGKQGAQLAKELRTYGDDERINGVTVWKALEARFGNDGAAEILQRLGAKEPGGRGAFIGAKNIKKPDEVMVFKTGAIRDAEKAAFNPEDYGLDNIYAGVIGGALGLPALLDISRRD